MNALLNSFKDSIRTFVKEEEGGQIVEYSLIIAVVSIALVIALATLAKGNGNPFGAFIKRVTDCLTTTACF